MNDRSHLLTEQRLEASMNFDRMSVDEALEVMNRQDAAAVAAVAAERSNVRQAIDLVVAALKSGGRLIYVGAGTSGRLAVVDASECPPTFSTDPNMVQAIIAGGPEAMIKSREGAEDDPAAGATAIDEKKIDHRDVVMGIAAGGTTPYVRGALDRAKSLGAKTIFFCCVQAGEGQVTADVTIRPLTGPEVLTGSTRLKAGTATKLVLNQITTIAMARIGKVYENLMVDVVTSNKKLWERGTRLVATLTGLSREEALQLLQSAGGEVKTAVVMHSRGLDVLAARKRLLNKSLREAMEG